MTSFSATAAPITETELQLIEQYAGLSLPAAYREHLLLHNGGECDPMDFVFMAEGIETESMVDAFLPVSDKLQPNLKVYIDTYKLQQKRMPDRMLPIAFDPGENLICISCSGPDLGAVFFWDHEAEVDYAHAPDTDQSNLFLIQNSLPAFLDSLKEESDDEWGFMNENN